MKIEGKWENERNQQHRDLYKEIIREVYGVTDVIVGHHLVYVVETEMEGGFKKQVVQEIPSADTLIFDHEIAHRLWGTAAEGVLVKLACTPAENRDAVLFELYHGRKK